MCNHRTHLPIVMGCQSQKRIGSIRKAKKKKTVYKKYRSYKIWKPEDNLAFDRLTHCKICNIEHNGSKMIKRAHHAMCPRNRATRGRPSNLIRDAPGSVVAAHPWANNIASYFGHHRASDDARQETNAPANARASIPSVPAPSTQESSLQVSLPSMFTAVGGGHSFKNDLHPSRISAHIVKTLNCRGCVVVVVVTPL